MQKVTKVGNNIQIEPKKVLFSIYPHFQVNNNSFER